MLGSPDGHATPTSLRLSDDIIPKSTNPTRIQQNIDLDSFEIDLPDLETISSLNRSDAGVAWPAGDPSMIN